MYDLEFAETAMGTWTVLRQTWIAVNRAAEFKLAKVGLTPEKVAVLWACKEYPATVTPAELARLVFRENQTLAGLLNRMEKEGLVTRVPKRKGHPFTEVKLTPKGEKVAGPGIEILGTLIKRLFDDVPEEEQKQLQKSLKKLRQKMMDEMHTELDKGPAAFKGKPITFKL
jgi:DNA-binding MarR family transcriptional regulator